MKINNAILRSAGLFTNGEEIWGLAYENISRKKKGTEINLYLSLVFDSNCGIRCGVKQYQLLKLASNNNARSNCFFHFFNVEFNIFDHDLTPFRWGETVGKNAGLHFIQLHHKKNLKLS